MTYCACRTPSSECQYMVCDAPYYININLLKGLDRCDLKRQ